MKECSRVLVITPNYPPSTNAGGPVRSVASVVERESSGHRIRVLTGDRDVGASEPYYGVAVGMWSPIGSAAVLRVRPRVWSVLGPVRRATSDADLIYLNSVFSPAFSLLPLLFQSVRFSPRRRILLAPRGELGAAALALKSYKKRPASWFLRRVLKSRLIAWHASGPREAREINTFMRGAPAHIIVQADHGPAPQRVSAPGRQPLTIAFVARMVPIKNFEQLVAAAQLTSMELKIIVAGNVEDSSYWRRCAPMLAALGERVTVAVRGALSQDEVHEVLRSADAMVLPTRGESFGHAIAEAMAVGCPVLIPDTTIWTPLVEAGAGRIIDTDDPGKLVLALRELDLMPRDGRLNQRKMVLSLYTQWWTAQEEHSASLFDDALSMSP